MKPTTVVNRRDDPYDVYIGRPSKWGNPYKIGRDGTRAEVIAKYEEWVRRRSDLMAALPELQGRVLGCWCKVRGHEPCHGDVLAEICNGTEPEEQQ